MKKSLIFVGMLAIGYANAQEGNVGINTENPKATLDIVPETSNLAKNTNEGIIAPRLTKARIAGIADANLVEGTLVYATDNTYTGANTKVSKITEKGYYFYNGTEWVKVQYKDTDTNDAEWVYDDTTKQIKLKRSGAGNFKNEVFYDATNGTFNDIEGGLTSTTQFIESVVSPTDGSTAVYIANTPLSDYRAGHLFHKKSSGLPVTDFRIQSGRIIKSKNFEYSSYMLDSDDNATNINNIFGHRWSTEISADNANDYSGRNIFGLYANTFGNGTGKVGSLEGANLSAIVNGSQSVSTIIGLSTGATVQTTGTVGQVIGVNNTTLVRSNTDKELGSARGARLITAIAKNTPALVKIIDGLYVEAKTDASNTGTGTHLRGGLIAALNTGATKYPNQIALELTSSATGTNLPTNNIGLKINNIVGKADDGNAYAIYTQSGDIRFGSLLGAATSTAATDKVVMADGNGVLKTQDVSSLVSSTEPWYNAANNQQATANNQNIYTMGRVGIGSTTPSVGLDVLGASWDRASALFTRVQTEGGPAGIVSRRARGTIETPEVLQKYDEAGVYMTSAYNGEVYNPISAMYGVVDEVEDGKKLAGALYFKVTPAGIDKTANGDLQTKMVLKSTGDLGINTTTPSEKLDVNGNARFRTLPSQTGGATDKLVVVDNTGVLKTVDRSAIAPANTTATNGVQNVASMECNATNRGKMNFIQGADGKSDVFGICMKNANGNYYWGYMVGGNNPTNGTGAFGSGL